MRVAFAVLGAFGEECGLLLRASRALGEMLASAPASLLGSPFAAHLDPRDRDRIVVELARLTSGAERSWEGEGRLRAADGGVVRVRLEAGVLPGAGGAAATIAVRLVELAAAFGDAAADRAEPGARSAGARPARACE